MTDKVATMRLPDGLSALILEATDQGYDVTITMRRRDDGRPGRCAMPTNWARRLGMSAAAIEAAKNDQS